MRHRPFNEGIVAPLRGARGRRGEGAREATGESHETLSFRCPECLNVFPTWTKLTQHFDTTRHFSAKCAECDQQLKCYGPAHPYRHEVATGHSGFFGIFYTRADYQLDHPPFLTHPQYRCECQLTFVSALQLAFHLRTKHGLLSVPDAAKCLTCHTEGTLAAMVLHRRERLGMKEDDIFDVPGFSAAPYLLRWPNLPPWPMQKRPYAIVYQCPVCVRVFTTWPDMRRHLQRSGPCSGAAPDARSEGRDSGGTRGLQMEDFEVLLDTSDRDMLALVGKDAAEQGEEARQEDSVLAYQCPEASCASVFLTHGELLEHMEKKNHRPPSLQSQEASTTQPDLSWKWNISAYEVMCTTRELVEIFRFAMCPLCGCPVPPGAEEKHRQQRHPKP